MIAVEKHQEKRALHAKSVYPIPLRHAQFYKLNVATHLLAHSLQTFSGTVPGVL